MRSIDAICAQLLVTFEDRETRNSHWIRVDYLPEHKLNMQNFVIACIRD